MAAAVLQRARAWQALRPSAFSQRSWSLLPRLQVLESGFRPCAVVRRAGASASEADAAAFVGITPGLTKEAQIAQKNSNVDKDGIWPLLSADARASIAVASRVEFVSWLGHGVSPGKAAIVRLFTAEEADAIIKCMGTSEGQAGVMTAAETAGLYLGRVNTARHLVADQRLADCIYARFRACTLPPETAGAAGIPFLSKMKYGDQIVAVNEKIRLVTTEEGGEHQKHADISEPSDDGLRISRLTFQCYLNPEAYEGGHFQLYLKEGGSVDIPVSKGEAVVFLQEDEELLHGGGKKGPGAAKRAIRGNLDAAR